MSEEPPHRRLAHDLRAPLGALFVWLDVLSNAKSSERKVALDALRAAALAHSKALDELLGAMADASPELAAPAGPEPDLAGLRVLVVDDDELMLDGLGMMLEERGVAVTAAASSREAVTAFERVGAVDAIVCDVSMPGEDGYACLRRLRALEGARGRTPALALTAYARPEDRARAVEAGFDLVLAKPTEPHVLCGVLARLTGR